MRATEQHRVGLDYLEAATTLLQRVRNAHPTKGLFEAGELQWWWRNQRSTDDLDQLFWFDELGRPEAAVIVTDWGDRIALTPVVMPDARPEWVAHVVERGLAHTLAAGFEAVEVEVDGADVVMREVLIGSGFMLDHEGFLAESWLAADARPNVSPLHDEYRLFSRLETMQLPHHMISERRKHTDVEPRLRETSLYRPDLDLAVHDSGGRPAAYGLFWFDPETATGVVEPMRTEEEHQQRGLARHVLTAGIDRLAGAGAERIKICFETNNPSARHLYLDVGFEPVKQTDVFTGPTRPQ